MTFAVEKEKIVELTISQTNSLFGIDDHEKELLKCYHNIALDKCAGCFALNPNKYFKRDGESYFNPFHSVQYMIYLYYLANSIYRKEGGLLICDKLYYLNKALNGIDLFYAVEMPDFFMAEHPVGSVIGRAKLGEGFSIFQNCTVGGSGSIGHEVYPVIGNNVTMYAGSMIIGDSKIGNNVSVGAGAVVKNQSVPDNSLVFGQSPNLIIKHKK